MAWDTLVQLEPLISKNQKLLKSAHIITLDRNPTIIFKIFFDEIEERVRGHFVVHIRSVSMKFDHNNLKTCRFLTNFFKLNSCSF